MKKYLLSDYKAAGCPEVNDQTGIVIFKLTNGKICDTGCNRYNNGECVYYKKLVKPKDVNGNAAPIETVRQEAKRRDVSIKQVRRERRDEATS